MTVHAAPPAAQGRSTELDWATHAVDTLRAAGHRRGAALVAIVGALQNGRTRTADELVADLRAAGRPGGRTTVYRVLDMLTEHGLVDRVETADGPARYAPRRGTRRYHLACEACGRLLRFDDDHWSAAIAALSQRLGAVIDPHATLLRGRCLHCSDAERAASCERCG